MTAPTLNRRALAGAIATGLAGAALAPRTANAITQQVLPTLSAVVTEAANVVRAQYVDPAMADRLAAMLMDNLNTGAYAAIPTRPELAQRLTADLRAMTNDLHMQVTYDPSVPTAETAADRTEDNLHPRTTGYGIQTVARLEGNIGLLRVTHFPSPPDKFASRYAAAMELLQTTSALILDLTINHGGGSDTYGFFLSYFLDGETELGRIAWRSQPLEIIKTSNAVPGKRYGETRPLYIAISNRTFSAGEAIAFQLRNRKRATLVGRPTRGGAHAGDTIKLPDNFRIFVVMGKGEGVDWEGTGVLPDIPADPEFAVQTAHRLAVESLLSKATDPMQQQILRNVQAHSIENLSSFAY